MSTIKLTPEQRDKKADTARIEYFDCDRGASWSELSEEIRNCWRRSVIAVLESDGNAVEIIEPEPEIPDEVVKAGTMNGTWGAEPVRAILLAAYKAGWGVPRERTEMSMAECSQIKNREPHAPHLYRTTSPRGWYYDAQCPGVATCGRSESHDAHDAAFANPGEVSHCEGWPHA